MCTRVMGFIHLYAFFEVEQLSKKSRRRAKLNETEKKKFGLSRISSKTL